MGSTADLLFRISADSTPAQGDLAAFRGKLAGELAGVEGQFAATSAGAAASFRGAMAEMGEASQQTGAKIVREWPVKPLVQDWDAVGGAAEAAGAKTVRSSSSARLAVKGLGEEVGVRMPRFVASWLMGLGPVAGIMSAAFAPIALVGLVEVLGKIPDALQKGVDWMHGWSEASKKAFEEAKKSTLDAESALIDYHDKLRAIQLIGLEGLSKERAEYRLNQTAIDEVVAKIVEYQARLTQLRAVSRERTSTGVRRDAMGVATVVPDEDGPSHAAMEKAKAEIEQIAPALDALIKKFADLSVETQRITAQTTADAAKSGRDQTQELTQRLLAQKEQTLAAARDQRDALKAVRLQQWDLEIDAMEAGYRREGTLTAAQSKMIAELRRLGRDRIETEDAEGRKREAEAAVKATDDLRRRLAGQQEQTLEARLRGWDAEIDELTAQYKRERQLTATNLELLAQMRRDGEAKIRREAGQQADEAHAELVRRLGGEATLTLEARHQQFDREMDEMRSTYQRKLQLTAENEQLIAALRVAGHRKIDADTKAAYDQEIAGLREHLAKIRAEQLTGAQRIAEQYDADVAKFSAAEERKALALATSEAQRTAIAEMYAQIRAALLAKEGYDLQALRNSQGWQGVFGAEFGRMLAGNEALAKQWAGSTNQSLMVLRVTMEGLRQTGREMFADLARGMGSGITSAFIYKKSIGEAMQAALASTLASIAAESAVWAIYATAMGFIRLAQHDYPAATAAFNSAAIWATVAGAAAVAGRVVAPAQGGVAASGGAGASASGGGAAGDPGAATGQGGGERAVVVVQFHGPVYGGAAGLQELTAAISDAVMTRDVKLIASGTKTGQVYTR